jgi:putative Mn2+ efflux pump MntP
MEPWVVALMFTAATVGSLHSLAPDHWMPFAALARARKWSQLRTARLTVVCGLGHVTVSAALGVLALILGQEAVQYFGATLQSNAALLLIGFGVAYTVWALWRNIRHRLAHAHGHPHEHHHVHAEPSTGWTDWSLFLFFCADPCVALIPMIMAASAGGWTAVATVILVYEVATIGTMSILVAAAHAGVHAIRLPWIDRYGDALAGIAIVVLGTAVTILGV